MRVLRLLTLLLVILITTGCSSQVSENAFKKALRSKVASFLERRSRSVNVLKTEPQNDDNFLIYVKKWKTGKEDIIKVKLTNCKFRNLKGEKHRLKWHTKDLIAVASIDVKCERWFSTEYAGFLVEGNSDWACSNIMIDVYNAERLVNSK